MEGKKKPAGVYRLTTRQYQHREGKGIFTNQDKDKILYRSDLSEVALTVDILELEEGGGLEVTDCVAPVVE